MKILVISNLYPPDHIGGYELGCRQVVDALLGRGHEVRVLTSAPRSRSVADAPHVLRGLALSDVYNGYFREHNLPVNRLLNDAASSFVNAFNVHSLLQELEDFGPDVAYVWNTVGLGGLGLMATLHHLRVPWVCHLMDAIPFVLCMMDGRAIPALAREFARQFRGRYLACSQQVVEENESRGGIRLEGEIELIPNWVQGPRPRPRATYYRGGRLRIVAAAALIDRQVDKGIDLVIEAAALLKEGGHDDFHVDVYGNVTDPWFPSLVRRLGLEEVVAFQGVRTQAELMDLYEQYDVFAFPTWEREPFAFAQLEAAAAGCVPVMTHICGNSEWFVDGVHVLKAARTAEAFAEVFRKILDRTIDLSAIGPRLQAVVQRDFHLDAILPRIEAALRQESLRPRTGGGTPDEVYRLALLAEKLTRIAIQEARGAA